MTAVDILGYVASVLAATSLMMKSVLRLRLISLVASVTFSVYGVLISSVPVAGLNILIVFINSYFLIQMFTKKTFFKLLEVDKNSAYMQEFLGFYQQDIGKFFPDFEYHPERADMVYLILRDLQPVGVFITQRDASGRAVVKLDYVIPGYRDLKAGQFLYRELEQRLPERGITTLYSVPGSERHQNYLNRMGFTPQGDKDKIKLYAEIMEVVHNMSPEMKRKTLEYVRSVKPIQGISGKTFIERTRDINIPPDELELMKQAIEEDCERIDTDEWSISS